MKNLHSIESVMVQTNASEGWCAVYTAWPTSTQTGRKPHVSEDDETQRAFTWGGLRGWGSSLEVGTEDR